MPLVVLNDTLYAIGGFDDLRFTPRADVWIYREDRTRGRRARRCPRRAARRAPAS